LTTTAWVAVDGGQSGTRLAASDGRRGTGPGFTHGGDPVATNLRIVARAAADAGLTGPVGTVCLGLTGLPADPAGRAELAARVAELLDARGEVRLCDDSVTAHGGALPEGRGVVLAAGTGVIALAVGDGVARRFDGHGYLFGDCGGSFAIGRAAMAAILRARDGRGPATALAGAEPGALYASPTVVDDVAHLAPQVFAAAAQGDRVARQIVEAAAADLAETVTAAVRAFPDTSEVPVAYTGGLFAAGPQLLTPLRAGLPPRARLHPSPGPPLTGAIRLASGPLGSYASLVSCYGRPAPAGVRSGA
jgi:N-acetylglucosamine kinase-like BadF-type ATPase